GILRHYEDSPLGRAVRVETQMGAEVNAGLIAIYKEGPAFEVIAIDLDGMPRADWAAAVLTRPIAVRPIAGAAAKGAEWRGMVRARDLRRARELRAVSGRDVERILRQLKHDPRWNRRDHIGEIAELHRLVVRLPVALACRHLLDRLARPMHFAFELSGERVFDSHPRILRQRCDVSCTYQCGDGRHRSYGADRDQGSGDRAPVFFQLVG